jgi:copper oxidase (laccase) domain-containing protein
MNSADGLSADEFGRACGITIADCVPSEVAL